MTTTTTRLTTPSTTRPRQMLWPYAISLIAIHLLALLAFVPWFFSWTGVILALLGCYVFGTLGINLCYHRLLTHQGFECPKWLEHFLAVLGVCCLQDTPARWVAIHRMHHQHSDEPEDPHSPLVNFVWGHFGWLMTKNRQLNNISMYERYSRDLLQQPFYMKLERNMMWIWIYLFQALLFYFVGFGVGWLMTESVMGSIQFGLSVLVWGVFVRTVLVWHITWAVNSATHLWGYRNYETGENSRNNWFVALVSNGEGWHNNHHAQPRAAAHGHRWWEIDVTFTTVRILKWCGLAWNVVLPKKQSRHLKPDEDKTEPKEQESPIATAATEL